MSTENPRTFVLTGVSRGFGREAAELLISGRPKDHYVLLARGDAESLAEAMADARTKTLVVTTRRQGDKHIEIEVADSGPGLSDSVVGKLFQPFTTTKSTGMGVGLSLCRSIIESQGGEISARNAADGGAVFRFTVAAA